ncbi:sugar transferase [Dysgonomonas macrotermitis]|uniref:Exopolysaccharide biosynthesis polyprenyl glycosylphosphotransferase n=1 Tax=Dysgonomonas macrotermitis TaxID=1346286 RepID=A0A1M5ADX7_9BACT|nr:sugar transferase [Dysgonomonas macrotermitis]SHF28501.1 exopolysaccharide biosynthesis polyprenyl glycosylphosphotransferase [Dysgonomonas macrotermitis]
MERFFTRKGFSFFILMVDLLIICLSTYISYLYFEDTLAAYNDNLRAIISMAPYIALFYLIIGHVFELDKPKEFTLFGVAYSVMVSIACLFLLTMAMSFLTRRLAYPRSILIMSSVIQVVLLSAWHLFINKRYLIANVKKTVVVIGYDKARKLAHRLLNSKGMWTNVKHICTPESPNLKEHIKDCDVAFLAEDVDESTKQGIAEYCVAADKEFCYEPRFQEIFLFNANFVQVEDTPILKVRPFDVNAESNFAKRILDLSICTIGGIILFIPFTIVAISLKIGGGSVFFKQERVTQFGRIFYIYKFRTMIENAEAMSGPVLAQEADKRITKLGHILRATRLDEIPQIYNIIKGDMSIVGPRPERPFFVEQFCKEIPEYDLRHRVKAGLTGLAQVQGKYNTSVQDKLKYDLLYINGYSFAMDVKLIMQTLTVLLKKSSTEGVKDVEQNEEFINKLIDAN